MCSRYRTPYFLFLQYAGCKTSARTENLSYALTESLKAEFRQFIYKTPVPNSKKTNDFHKRQEKVNGV